MSLDTSRVRRFWLEDVAGELVGLNGERGMWFVEPEGLGVEEAASYESMTDGFFLATESVGMAQAQIGGALVFKGHSPYIQFRWLTDWIHGAGELYFVYQPGKQADTFRRRVALTQIEKGELERCGWLRCAATFSALSPWMTAEVTTTTTVVSGGATVTVQPKGHLPRTVNILLEMHDANLTPVSQPELVFTGYSSSKEYGRMKLTEAVDGNNTKLYYSNEPNNSYVRLLGRDNVTVTDLIDLLDLAYEPFPTLPRDVSVPVGNQLTAYMTVEARTYLRSV